MLNSFISSIEKEKLFNRTEKILLTVSGGIDSIIMCELFHKAGLKFGIAHCNFNLRDEESNDDEIFVKELAEKYKVQFHSVIFNTTAFAKKNKLSIQIAARQLRYNWFEEIREQFSYKYIATAHHQDDSIETFFINLIRGTGIAGLHGILPKQGKIIRPLLFADKEEIISFAKKNKLEYREDSSNRSDKYVRNKIRHKLIPLLKELNPNIHQTISHDIKLLSNVEKVYKKEISDQHSKIIKKEKNSFHISIARLKKLNPLEPYLFEFLFPLGFNSSTVDEITTCLDGQSGKQFFSSTHRLIKDREFLLIEPLNPKTRIKKTIVRPLELPEKKFLIKKNQKTIKLEGFEIRLSSINVKDHQLQLTKDFANLDLEKLEFPLEVRKWNKGDSFFPLGMKNKKKLSDFFIDNKIPVNQKEKTWLLTSKDKIVWVIGLRIDDRFKITDKTKKIYFAERV
ncbi:MAG: tRNA lysidine(34) synthetase TilS [Bacteroidetes bacterium]|nr:tRNA lysidine(34) synthetase TilS [Bacteroidota bacterium]